MSTEMNINNIFTPSPPDNNILSIINLSELDNIILESIIPEQTKRQFIPGKFLYIDSEQERIMLQNAWAAITQLELWVYMQLNTESYMFNDHHLINLISKKMVDLGYDGHSGSSFGWTMRQMQYIAINGEEVYMIEYKR
jgi:hypothetical protein